MAGRTLPVEQEMRVPFLRQLDVGIETERIADVGVRGVSAREEQVLPVGRCDSAHSGSCRER